MMRDVNDCQDCDELICVCDVDASLPAYGDLGQLLENEDARELDCVSASRRSIHIRLSVGFGERD